MVKEKIPKTIISLGWAMLILNISYMMIYGLSAIYLQQKGISQKEMGLLEGSVEALSQLMRLGSGFLIDLFKKHKLLIIIGYGLSMISRPVMAFSTDFANFFFGRILERFANGTQGTARDALVADIAPKNMRGRAFGLKRSMGITGSVLGGLISYIVLKNFEADISFVFKLSIIPAVIAFLIVLFAVKGPKKNIEVNESQGFSVFKLSALGINFGLLMLINAVFATSRISEQFMIRFGYNHFGIGMAEAPLIMVIFNMSYTLSTYPIGVFSDKTNRFGSLGVGILALVCSAFMFYRATTSAEFWFGVLLWGVQMGITTNTFTALIVDLVPRAVRGTAFGIFYLLNAICFFTADSVGGYIAHYYGQNYAYLISACIGSVSLGILMIVMKYRDLSHKHG